MRIVGFTETSLLDWHGRIAAVLWIGGCDFACPFCHNHLIADDAPELQETPWDDIARTLQRKRDWYDGVVLTGGEPLMHPEVFELCRRLGSMGLKVKIDTNGSFPYALKAPDRAELVDAVAMDVKAPLDRATRKRPAGRSTSCHCAGPSGCSWRPASSTSSAARSSPASSTRKTSRPSPRQSRELRRSPCRSTYLNGHGHGLGGRNPTRGPTSRRWLKS